MSKPIPVLHEAVKLLFRTFIIIIKSYPEVLFSMTKDILINMPAAEKSVDLISKDIINRIGKS
jgi:hypothetical protein